MYINPTNSAQNTACGICHEAIAQTPVEGAASGTIVEVYSQGYRYRDDVLRPAKVVVAA